MNGEARTFLIGLGALVVLGGVSYIPRNAICGDRLAARIPPGGRSATLWSHHGAAWDSWVRNELARHSPYGNWCNSVGVGGQFLASATRAYVEPMGWWGRSGYLIATLNRWRIAA
jgi:hypothetical protein